MNIVKYNTKHLHSSNIFDMQIIRDCIVLFDQKLKVYIIIYNKLTSLYFFLIKVFMLVVVGGGGVSGTCGTIYPFLQSDYTAKNWKVIKRSILSFVTNKIRVYVNIKKCPNLCSLELVYLYELKKVTPQVLWPTNNHPMSCSIWRWRISSKVFSNFNG